MQLRPCMCCLFDTVHSNPISHNRWDRSSPPERPVPKMITDQGHVFFGRIDSKHAELVHRYLVGPVHVICMPQALECRLPTW